MRKHLSDRQVAAWITGERSAAEEAHVRECAACRTAVARLENAVAAFRGALQEWSSSAVPEAGWFLLPKDRRSALWKWRLVVATAMLAIVAGVPIYRTLERQREIEQARADALLLEQVDAELTRSVPAPMEPLWNLVPGEIR